MHLNDLLFLLPKISFFPNLHPEMFPEYVFERGFTNSASFSQFPLIVKEARFSFYFKSSFLDNKVEETEKTTHPFSP